MLDFATVEFAVNVFTVLSRSFALKSFVCFHALRLVDFWLLFFYLNYFRIRLFYPV